MHNKQNRLSNSSWSKKYFYFYPLCYLQQCSWLLTEWPSRSCINVIPVLLQITTTAQGNNLKPVLNEILWVKWKLPLPNLLLSCSMATWRHKAILSIICINSIIQATESAQSVGFMICIQQARIHLLALYAALSYAGNNLELGTSFEH